MLQIEITTAHGNSSHTNTYTARDGAHADRIVARKKAAAPQGASVTTRRYAA